MSTLGRKFTSTVRLSQSLNARVQQIGRWSRAASNEAKCPSLAAMSVHGCCNSIPNLMTKLGDQAEEFDEILVKGHHTTVRGAQERATEHPAQQVRLFLVKGSHSLGHKSVVLPREVK